MRKPPKRPHGRQTPPRSETLDLGKYVTLRPRVDGSYRVFLQVPNRLRPCDWPSLIPLPRIGERRGDLGNELEVARIRADASQLYLDLLNARRGEVADAERRDIATLVRSWVSTQRYKATRPKTQKGYDYHASLIDDWSIASHRPPVATIRPAEIETFLANYDDRPTTRRHVLVVLKMLLDHAVDLEWIDKSPAARIQAAAPKSKVSIWEMADVTFYSQAAFWAGKPALAAMILTQWEIGQRLTDARLFRRGKKGSGAEYDAADGVFRFWQAKTNSYVTIPISRALVDMLDLIKSPDSPHLFVDRETGQPWDENSLSKAFIALRKQCPAGRHLVLRALRHSCVVQLARSACTVPEIASITGHSILSVERILSAYLPRDNEVAWNAQAKRGLVEKREALA